MIINSPSGPLNNRYKFHDQVAEVYSHECQPFTGDYSYGQVPLLHGIAHHVVMHSKAKSRVEGENEAKIFMILNWLTCVPCRFSALTRYREQLLWIILLRQHCLVKVLNFM